MVAALRMPSWSQLNRRSRVALLQVPGWESCCPNVTCLQPHAAAFFQNWGSNIALSCVRMMMNLRCSPQIHRSEEHTSELQSRGHLVCRLLLEKKKINSKPNGSPTRPLKTGLRLRVSLSPLRMLSLNA